MTPMRRDGRTPSQRPLARFASVAAILFVATSVMVGCDRGSAPDATEERGEEAPPFAAVEDTTLRSALLEVREATEKFGDVEVAEEAGYIRDPMNLCYGATDAGLPAQLGQMGVHYFRPDLLGVTQEKPRIDGTGTHTDFSTPGVLVYEPQADGSMELVAVENLVFKEAWDEQHDEKPSFHGLEYYPMTDNPRTEIDEAHHFRPHYELHLWVHRENPVAVYSEWNPNVTCEHHGQRAAGAETAEAGAE